MELTLKLLFHFQLFVSKHKNRQPNCYLNAIRLAHVFVRNQYKLKTLQLCFFWSEAFVLRFRHFKDITLNNLHFNLTTMFSKNNDCLKKTRKKAKIMA